MAIIPAIICLFLALQWGGTAHSWDSMRIVALLVVAAVLFIVFLGIQYHQQEAATVPPRIFKKRTVWASAIFAFNTGVTYLIGVYFLPIWFQAVKGSSAVESGFLIMPLLLGVVVLSVLAGMLVTWCGYYAPFMIFGSILAAVGGGLYVTITPDTTSFASIGFQILAGSGIGCGLQQPLMSVQTVLDISDIATGVSIVIFLQNVGAALAVAVGQTVLANKLVQGLQVLVPDMNPSIVLDVGATSIREHVPEYALEGVTMAYSDALAQTFIVCAATGVAAFVASLAVEWKSVKAKKESEPEASA